MHIHIVHYTYPYCTIVQYGYGAWGLSPYMPCFHVYRHENMATNIYGERLFVYKYIKINNELVSSRFNRNDVFIKKSS